MFDLLTTLVSLPQTMIFMFDTHARLNAHNTPPTCIHIMYLKLDCKSLHTHTHACTHTYSHEYTLTHTFTHTCTHTHTLTHTGTDEAAIINLLVTRTNAQRQLIRNKFKLLYGKVKAA